MPLQYPRSVNGCWNYLLVRGSGQALVGQGVLIERARDELERPCSTVTMHIAHRKEVRFPAVLVTLAPSVEEPTPQGRRRWLRQGGAAPPCPGPPGGSHSDNHTAYEHMIRLLVLSIKYLDRLHTLMKVGCAYRGELTFRTGLWLEWDVRNIADSLIPSSATSLWYPA